MKTRVMAIMAVPQVHREYFEYNGSYMDLLMDLQKGFVAMYPMTPAISSVTGDGMVDSEGRQIFTVQLDATLFNATVFIAVDKVPDDLRISRKQKQIVAADGHDIAQVEATKGKGPPKLQVGE